ncbi:MAG TPA: 50S ribosomal protein L20 [Planctomycetota bacterium]|nr:50S ribosomal protein L20 [Planctomycetota bacterium]
MRVTNAVARRKRHKKTFKAAKGYRGGRGRLLRTAKEAVKRAGAYATRDRRNKKREWRSLFIVRINGACREAGVSYSQFMNGLKRAGVVIDRKQLSDLAVNDPAAFAGLVNRFRPARGAAAS